MTRSIRFHVLRVSDIWIRFSPRLTARNKAATVQSLQRAPLSHRNAFPDVHVHSQRKTTDVLAMTSFFMAAVLADRPCPLSSANSPAGKILPHRERRNTSGASKDRRLRERPLRLRRTRHGRRKKDDTQRRAILSRNIHVIFLRADELISVPDTSVKSS